MSRSSPTPLPHGIVPVVQTPFDDRNRIDFEGVARLVEEAIAAGAAGLLTPVVASEVAYLSAEERRQLVRHVSATVSRRVPLLVGASADDPVECRAMTKVAEEVGAAAVLIAVPQMLYAAPNCLMMFFRQAVSNESLPLVIQDFQFGGPGLSMDMIRRLHDALPTLRGLKIETVPAGPKYTCVREAFGAEFYIAGGWAIMQMIEALDRGVDAMIPESSMVRLYVAIDALYRAGERDAARRLFHSLLPVLAFTNQEVATSIAFFKRLLVRKGIFRGAALRWPGFAWDRYNERIADELIDAVLAMENENARGR